MKKNILKKALSLALTFCMVVGVMPASVFAAPSEGDIELSAANFPDDGFRECLALLDRDGDGYISSTLPNDTLYVDLASTSATPIHSIEGAELFTNLKALVLYGFVNGTEKTPIELGNVDLSNLNSLVTVGIQGCGVTSVNANNSSLEKLTITKTPISSLDVTNTPNLTYLNISDTRIVTIDITHNPKLERFIAKRTVTEDSLNDPEAPLLFAQNLDLRNNPLLANWSEKNIDIQQFIKIPVALKFSDKTLPSAFHTDYPCYEFDLADFMSKFFTQDSFDLSRIRNLDTLYNGGRLGYSIDRDSGMIYTPVDANLKANFRFIYDTLDDNYTNHTVPVDSSASSSYSKYEFNFVGFTIPLSMTNTLTTDAVAKAGDVIEYSVSIKNTQDVPLTGIGFEVSMMDEDGNSVTPSVSGYDDENRIFLQPGETKVIDVSYTATEEDVGKTFNNSASIFEGGDPVGSAKYTIAIASADPVTVEQSPVTVKKTLLTDTTAYPGNVVRYKIDVKNNTNNRIDNLFFDDSMKSGTTAVTPTISLAGNGNAGIGWSVEAGATESFNVEYTVVESDVGKNLNNHATISQGDGVVGSTVRTVLSESDAAPVQVVAAPLNISVTKTLLTDTVAYPGDKVQYEVSVTNNSDYTNLLGLYLKETMKSGNTAVTPVVNGSGYNEADGFQMLPHTTDTFTVEYVVTENDVGNVLSNHVDIESGSSTIAHEVIASADADTVTVKALVPDVSISETLKTPANILAGDKIKYEIVVTNNDTKHAVANLGMTHFMAANGYTITPTITPALSENFSLAAGETKTFTVEYTTESSDYGKIVGARVSIRQKNPVTGVVTLSKEATPKNVVVSSKVLLTYFSPDNPYEFNSTSDPNQWISDTTPVFIDKPAQPVFTEYENANTALGFETTYGPIYVDPNGGKLNVFEKGDITDKTLFVVDESVINTDYGVNSASIVKLGGATREGYEFLGFHKTTIGILGDANGDGYINAADASVVGKYLNGDDMSSFKDFELRADFNGDGVVDQKDVDDLMHFATVSDNAGTATKELYCFTAVWAPLGTLSYKNETGVSTVVTPEYASILAVNPNGGSYKDSTATALEIMAEGEPNGTIAPNMTLADPVRRGYSFTGWKLESAGLAGDVDNSGSVGLNDMTLIVMYKGGKIPDEDMTKYYGEDWKLRLDVNRDGQFNDVDLNYMIAMYAWRDEIGNNVHLYKLTAQWTSNSSSGTTPSSKYSITYHDNNVTSTDGSYKSGTVVVVKGSEVFKAADGYTLQGWATSANGAIKYYAGDKITLTKNVNLYAVWTPLNVTDHFAYLQGYIDGGFRPDDNMTRAEVAVMFSRLLNEKIDDDAGSSVAKFSDTDVSAWYAKGVGALQEKNILTGYVDGTFRPDAPITRAEFVTIASKFYGLTDTVEVFPDCKDHWAKNYISTAAARGWATGYLNGNFYPDNNISRAEVTALVNRMLSRYADKDYTGKVSEFTDITNGHWAYLDVMEATNTHDFTRPTATTEAWTNVVPVK